MLEFEEMLATIQSFKPDLKDICEALHLKDAQEEILLLEKTTTDPCFWNNSEQSQKTLKRLSGLKLKIERYNKLHMAYEDTKILIELANDAEDISLVDESRQELEKIRRDIEAQRLELLLRGEFDCKNAILTLHAGAGGTEAQDWAEMLYRMYCRWGERHNYRVKTLDFLDGESAGLKSVSILIEGLNAYGYLKGESGVHRLVRISPFDSSGRRHTSFASAEVIPEFDDDIAVDIAPDDLKMDVFRSSGAGGQHVNKTSSAVRLTHLPTGIVSACQNERSQHQNREVALKMIKSKLMEIKQREHLERIEDIKGDQKEIGWGSQIRSYVFMPYTMVKDHITGYEVGNINAVMDGDLDGFINAYLRTC